jgi:broad specificity phosphatase PhoE
VIVVVRHGETEWSLSGQHTSRTDLPLIEEGRRRAKQVGAQLMARSFALVLCSPLLRARETCELAGFGEQAVLSNDLHEWDYGDYEGLTTAQIHHQCPDWDLWRDGCPGGEQPEEIAARADRAIAQLCSAAGDALAFAHGHILRVMSARWIALPAAGGARLALAAGAICELGFERETEVIQLWNATD